MTGCEGAEGYGRDGVGADGCEGADGYGGGGVGCM